MSPIKVAVHGAAGKMGQEIVRALCREPEMNLVGAVDAKAAADHLDLPDGSGKVPFSAKLDSILSSCRPEVLVDFTIARATLPAARLAAEKGVNLVIGTTGLTPEDITEMERLAESRNIGIVVASNFTIGAVLMMHLAKIASKYLDSAEIIELHHNQKLDAPSGTSLSTARGMLAARGGPFQEAAGKKDAPSRGENIDGVRIHSIRLPGYMAHQEVIFGAPGQTLTIRHDTISRECYMPGIMLAIREVMKRKGRLTYGLDTLLGL